MAIMDSVGVGSYASFRDPFDRARETKELIEIAEKCGIVADADLFWKIVDRVYPNMTSEYAEIMKPLVEVMAAKNDCKCKTDETEDN